MQGEAQAGRSNDPIGYRNIDRGSALSQAAECGEWSLSALAANAEAVTSSSVGLSPSRMSVEGRQEQK
jgi:hypothetical protein